MAIVGTKYQVVIEKEARRKLGIRPGWVAFQTVVGDHLEVRFVPPEQDGSLAGSLNAYAQEPPLEVATEKRRGWEAEVNLRWGRG